MDLIVELKSNIKNALNKLGIEASFEDVFVEKSRDINHGDYASNVCLKFCKKAGKNPVEFAKLLENELDKSLIIILKLLVPAL